MGAVIGDARKSTAIIMYEGLHMKATNYVITVYWLAGKRIYMMERLEEAMEFIGELKKDFPTLRITLKRERREFEYWLSLIFASAPQAT